MAAVELPELLVPDSGAWREWLADHSGSPGVWLVLHKKGGDVTKLGYEDAVLQALCFGWIDGQVARRDEGSYRQRFTPRKPRSAWSATNVARVTRLIADGQLMPAGLAAVEAARRDGRWDAAYQGQRAAETPADLLAAIARVPAAQQMYEVLNAANRYALYYRVIEAKRPDTRARRIAEFVQMLARGETPHPQAGTSRAATPPAAGP
ncbi:YdeI/OmpD-associated family protein [soil metagenome]